jgi:hypothetical protein
LNYEPALLERSANRASGERRAPGLGGYIGMSGWLPFAEDISSSAAPGKAEEHGNEDDDDPFYSTGGLGDKEKLDDSVQARQLQAANFARDIVELHALSKDASPEPSFAHVPYFLGHGTADEKVSVRLGEQARDVPTELELDVTWKPHQIFGQWYKEPDEIDDIAQFCERRFIRSLQSRRVFPSPPMKPKFVQH